jgi:hypothetical protein
VVARCRASRVFSHHPRLIIHRILRLRRAVERRSLRHGHRDARMRSRERPRAIARERKTRNCVRGFQRERQTLRMEWLSLAPTLIARRCRRARIADCDGRDHRLATIWALLHPRSGVRGVKWGLDWRRTRAKKIVSRSLPARRAAAKRLFNVS